MNKSLHQLIKGPTGEMGIVDVMSSVLLKYLKKEGFSIGKSLMEGEEKVYKYINLKR